MSDCTIAAQVLEKREEPAEYLVDRMIRICRDQLMLPIRQTMERIDCHEICFMESRGHNVYIYTKNREIRIYQKLTDLVDLLPDYFHQWALMPFVGWLLGSQFQKYITSIDHWIAFILLGFIGGKMMIEAVREWNEEEVVDVMDAPIDHKNMLVLAVATSIDALTVGITFAFLGTPIVEAITIIGITTMVISIAGVVVGNFFGSRYKSKAEFIGGLILVLLGLKILLEHLGILVF